MSSFPRGANGARGEPLSDSELQGEGGGDGVGTLRIHLPDDRPKKGETGAHSTGVAISASMPDTGIRKTGLKIKRIARSGASKLGGGLLKSRHTSPSPADSVDKDRRTGWYTSDNPDMLACRMAQRRRDYTKMDSLRVFCATWNVNGKQAVSVKDILTPSSPPMDIYAIGFQELDLRAEALLLNESDREKDWINKIENDLGPSYVQLKTIRLVGMLLVVYVRQDQRQHFQTVDAHCVGTGLLRKMGNKGGVAVRIKHQFTSICFVCSHFAAHQEEVERRNEDFHDILSKITFSDETGINDCDVVLWMGDLNYRLDTHWQMLDVEVRKAAASSDYLKLLPYDQLNKEMQLGHVFGGFTEGPLTFRPTYKYDPGTDTFDTSEKSRNPAWCDRILYRGFEVDVLAYQSCVNLKKSDHKPVSAVFSVPVRVSDPELEKVVAAEEMFKIDQMTNIMLPQVELSSCEVTFEEVKFLDHHTDTITVTNVGLVSCHFSFVGEGKSFPPWLTVKPSSALLMPSASQALTFHAEAHVSDMAELNRKPNQETILVLHLENSRDFFINVCASFNRSLFGLSLQELATMPSDSLSRVRLRSGAVHGDIDTARAAVQKTRDLRENSQTVVPVTGSLRPRSRSLEDVFDFELTSPSMAEQSPHPTVDGAEAAVGMRPPLWALLDLLNDKGVNTVDLFIGGTAQKDVIAVRDTLDGNGNMDSLPPRAVAMALLLFLLALPEPLFPWSLQAECVAVAGSQTQSEEALGKLPSLNVMTFSKIAALLTRLLENSANNHVSRNVLLSVFCDALFHLPREGASHRQRQKKLTQFIGMFI